MSFVTILRSITGHPLNRDNKLNSLIRFAKWQLSSRLAPGPIVVDWINGSCFLAKPGETGLTGNIYTGLYEFVDMSFILHFMRSDDLFIDVGANMGIYTILACAAGGSRGIAFEPIPLTYKRLCENIHLNYLDNRVQCFNCGVGASSGKLAFTINDDAMNRVVVSDQQHEHVMTIDVKTLDEVLRDETPTILKIDVEGYEAPVLDGAFATLSNPNLQCAVIELNGSGNHYGFDENAIISTMSKHGFGTYAYEPRNRMLTPLNGRNLNSGNTLFIRDLTFVAERVQSGPQFTVYGHRF